MFDVLVRYDMTRSFRGQHTLNKSSDRSSGIVPAVNTPYPLVFTYIRVNEYVWMFPASHNDQCFPSSPQYDTPIKQPSS